MSGWTSHSGMAVCLTQNNIDTDQLIPARFMSQPRADGYQDFLLYDVRRKDNGEINPDYPLNRFTETSILICGNNFGSGSSREAAAYALYDAGIRVVMATSFGDIFSANAVNNGVLPATLHIETHRILTEIVGTGSIQCDIDLQTKTVTMKQQQFNFELEASWQTKLINGWDEIDLTLQHQPHIDTFKAQYKKHHPWTWPQTSKS